MSTPLIASSKAPFSAISLTIAHSSFPLCCGCFFSHLSDFSCERTVPRTLYEHVGEPSQRETANERREVDAPEALLEESESDGGADEACADKARSAGSFDAPSTSVDSGHRGNDGAEGGEQGTHRRLR
jgi:hypothetical protein